MKVLHDMLLPRSGAGAIPCSARILLMVLRPSSCPRFLSAPRRRVYPHVGFSCATRTMSLTDVLRRRRSAWAPVLAAIVLGCDEVAVPAQKRSGCGNGRNLGQRLAAQSLGLDREPAPVVVREPETLAPKPGSERTVLLLLVVDHILLLAVDPAS